MDFQVELVLNVQLELIQLEEQQHVKLVLQVLIQQQEQVVVQHVQMENMHLQLDYQHVQHVQQHVMEIV